MLNKTAQPAKWEMRQRFARVSCCRYSIASCRSITCHFLAIRLSMAPGVPRLGPGFLSQGTAARLCQQPVRLAGVNMVFRRGRKTLSDAGLAKHWFRIDFVCHVAGCEGWVGCHPRCVIISYGRGIIIEDRENLNVRTR